MNGHATSPRIVGSVPPEVVAEFRSPPLPRSTPTQTWGAVVLWSAPATFTDREAVVVLDEALGASRYVAGHEVVATWRWAGVDGRLRSTVEAAPERLVFDVVLDLTARAGAGHWAVVEVFRGPSHRAGQVQTAYRFTEVEELPVTGPDEAPSPAHVCELPVTAVDGGELGVLRIARGAEGPWYLGAWRWEMGGTERGPWTVPATEGLEPGRAVLGPFVFGHVELGDADGRRGPL